MIPLDNVRRQEEAEKKPRVNPDNPSYGYASDFKGATYTTETKVRGNTKEYHSEPISQKRLTSGGDSAIINKGEREYGVQYGHGVIVADMDYIMSDDYAHKFDGVTGIPAVDASLLSCSRRAIEHRSGTEFEDIFFIHGATGEVLAEQTEMDIVGGVEYNDKIHELLKRAATESIPLITVHNHPEGFPPSVYDFNKAFDNNTFFGIAAGHNGQVYRYERPSKRIDGANEIHAILDMLYKAGSDPDRVYMHEFEPLGLIYNILKGGSQ